MDLTIINIFLVFGAGLASVLSPCVLPVVPIVVTGTEDESPWRPLFIVAGLSTTFIAMGIISSLFRGVLAGKMILLERIAGAIILLFGILFAVNINVFKRLTFFQRFQKSGPRKTGVIAGFILGATLGIVWIPCVGPMLSSVLATVAIEGAVSRGIVLLSIYSMGFAIPLLVAAYGSHLFRSRVSLLQKHPVLLRGINGAILILFGLYMLTKEFWYQF